MGKQVEVTGADLNAESIMALQQMGAEITAEYDRELNPEPTQLLYDSITDHSRNEVVVQDAVDHALKNASIESAPPASPDAPK
jgi:UDP-N-acetylmuramate-alanine ligase